MKIISNNFKQIKKEIAEKPPMYPMKIICDECGSELEIMKEDTHIGWLGAVFATCPCCNNETMICDLDGITLTKDTLIFPQHFLETCKGMRGVSDIPSGRIVSEINRGIKYLRENKDEYCWMMTSGDVYIVVFKYDGDGEYQIMVTRHFYETTIPFENEDYLERGYIISE